MKNLALLQDEVERMQNARNPEKDAENDIDEGVLGRLGFQINRQRREQNCQNNQNHFAHIAVPFLAAGLNSWPQESRLG